MTGDYYTCRPDCAYLEWHRKLTAVRGSFSHQRPRFTSGNATERGLEDIDISRPLSPKQPSPKGIGNSTWYRYYAGFSPRFVRAALRRLELKPSDLLIDPWNGSGTTTDVAEQLRLRYWGGDINPAMVVVAKARLVGEVATPSEESLCEAILQPSASPRPAPDCEPLESWFAEDTARAIRTLERRISELLDPQSRSGVPNSGERISQLSPLACYFYLALFRATRELLRPFFSKNPTWIRIPSSPDERIRRDAQDVRDAFRAELQSIVRTRAQISLFSHERSRIGEHPEADVSSVTAPVGATHPSGSVAVADSKKIPLKTGSVSAVISSPPYCTRLDYAVATSPELAVLGFSTAQSRALRDAMLGTTSINKVVSEIDLAWGPTCCEFLSQVANHQSKASSTYYLKNHLQYFNALSQSLREIDRVLARKSRCILVVQDSYYKEVHNDLQTVISEMGVGLGWTLTDRHDYESRRHIGRVNVGAKKYRPHPRATESILVYRTADERVTADKKQR